MLLLNIDEPDPEDEDGQETLDEIRAALKGIPFPNVILPHGLDDTKAAFGRAGGGYGTLLIGPDGIVRGLDPKVQDLPGILKEILPAEPPVSQEPKVGAPFRPFTLKAMDGRTVTLADYKGRALLIDGWGVS